MMREELLVVVVEVVDVHVEPIVEVDVEVVEVAVADDVSEEEWRLLGITAKMVYLECSTNI